LLLVRGPNYETGTYSMVDDPDGVIRTFGKKLIPQLGRERGGTR
jgi:hypothetical protein